MKTVITSEEILHSIDRCYFWYLYDSDYNPLFSEDIAVAKIAERTASDLFNSRFILITWKPKYTFDLQTMMCLLAERGFSLSLHENSYHEKYIRAVNGFTFVIQETDGGCFVTTHKILNNPPGCNYGRMEDMADWMESIAGAFDTITSYAKDRYAKDLQLTMIDKILAESALQYFPDGLKSRFKVFHDDVMAGSTTRYISIELDDCAVESQILGDVEDLQGVVEKLLNDKKVQTAMKEWGIIL